MITQMNPRLVVLMIFATCVGWLLGKDDGAVLGLSVVAFFSVLFSWYDNFKRN